MTKLAVIYGSSRPSKAGETVAKWFMDKVDAGDATVDMIDLAELDLPMHAEPMPPMMGEYSMESSKAWSEKVKGYDGFLFVAAEYNLGYTPILKNAIDSLYHEWTGKKAAIISYGAYPTSTSAEQLRVVLSAPKMDITEPTLHVTPIHEAVGEDGKLDESKVSGDSPQEIFDSLLG